jgi:hypothetical protein
LEPVWTTSGFDRPESVLISADTSFLYVSSIVGSGGSADGEGFISKLGKDGKIIELHWVGGIDAPKGMALKGDSLFVSNIDELVEIDTRTGEVLTTIPAPGAKFLNDVAYMPGLGVLVSGSSTKSLYLYDGETMSLWLQDDQLGGINGLHVDGERVLIVTMSAGELLSLDPKTKTLTVLASGMENADGIKVLKDGSYFTSSWPGQLYHVSTDGQTKLMRDTSETKKHTNDFDLDGDTVYIANLGPGTVEAIKLKLD